MELRQTDLDGKSTRLSRLEQENSRLEVRLKEKGLTFAPLPTRAKAPYQVKVGQRIKIKISNETWLEETHRLRREMISVKEETVFATCLSVEGTQISTSAGIFNIDNDQIDVSPISRAEEATLFLVVTDFNKGEKLGVEKIAALRTESFTGIGEIKTTDGQIYTLRRTDKGDFWTNPQTRRVAVRSIESVLVGRQIKFGIGFIKVASGRIMAITPDNLAVVDPDSITVFGRPQKSTSVIMTKSFTVIDSPPQATEAPSLGPICKGFFKAGER